LDAIAVIVALWAICGVASAAIANSKGLNPAAWFLIGALLGIIGVIIAAALQPTVEHQAARAAAVEAARGTAPSSTVAHPIGFRPEERECPFCAEVVKAKAIKCKHCGSEIGDPEPAAESVDPETPAATEAPPTPELRPSLTPDLVGCPNCRRDINTRTQRCPYCGVRVEEARQARAAIPTEPGRCCNCGEGVHPDTERCPYCKAHLRSTQGDV
jgi:hypothetical protein